jgi:hypothetical protein
MTDTSTIDTNRDLIPNKFTAKLNKKRNTGGAQAVCNYVETLSGNFFTPENVEQFRPHLTAEELDVLDRMLEEAPRIRAEREAQAKAEAEAKEAKAKAEAEAEAKRQREIDAFWAKNPPNPLTAEKWENADLSDEEVVFDILARYRISIIEYTFRPEYHWDEFLNVGDHDITFWLSDDLQMNQSLYFKGDELPEDEDDEIKDTLEDAIHTIADEYATDFASNRKIEDDGTVTFDIAARKITVSAECETTRTFKKSWSV